MYQAVTDVEDMTKSLRTNGHVKWFDVTKGFGFLVSDEISSDVLLHINVLRSFGQNSVLEESIVEFEAQLRERGWQVVAIHAITPPPLGALDGEELSSPVPMMAPEGVVYPARIKWFDRGRGFGFANVYGRPEDVFVHHQVLRASGIPEVMAGEAVALRVTDGDRGLVATQVLAWDSGMGKPVPDG